MSFFTFEWLERRRRRRGIMGIGEFLLEAKCLSNSRAWTHRHFSLCVIIRFMSENVWASFSLSLSLLSAITMRNGDSMANISIHITVFLLFESVEEGAVWRRLSYSVIQHRVLTTKRKILKWICLHSNFVLDVWLFGWMVGWLERSEELVYCRFFKDDTRDDTTSCTQRRSRTAQSTR